MSIARCLAACKAPPLGTTAISRFSRVSPASLQAAVSSALSAVRHPAARSFRATATLAAAGLQPPKKASGSAKKNSRQTRKAAVPSPSSLLPSTWPLSSVDAAPVSVLPSQPLPTAQLPPTVAGVVAACALQRAMLRAKAPFLMVKPSEWTVSKVAEFNAAGSDIKVLKRDPVTQRVTLAMATIPKIDGSVIAGPKGTNSVKTCFTKSMSATSTVLLFDEQRIGLVEQLLDSTLSHESLYGVLFSGPNGVGKSSICLEAALFCFAMGTPSVYISTVGPWVTGSNSEHQAQAYVMTRLFLQNADLIIGPNSELEPFFREQLLGQPAQASSYISLTFALEFRRIRPMVMTLDETQVMTKAASAGKPFFGSDFIVWIGPSSHFRSILCASAHGLREFKMPSGEESRLRFIDPMRLDDVDLLLQEPGSPFHHRCFEGSDRAMLRTHVGKLTGGMPRDLFRLVKYLESMSDPSDPSDNFIEKIRKRIELAANELIFDMQDDAVKQWIDQNRSVYGRVSAAHKISALLSLFRDTAAFAPAVKDLYDFGLVKRTKRGTVTPCSQMACEALSFVFACLLTDETPLHEESNGAKRGYQLEQRFFHAMMLPANARSFKVHPARSPDSQSLVKLGASLMQTTRCEDLSDIEPIPMKRSLWIPSSSTSVFDGILMPALEDIGAEPIVIFDPSVTEPYETDRRLKAKRLNALCGIMKLRFESKCSPVPLMIWDGELSSLERPEGDKLCKGMPEDVMIMDRGGLRSLGLAL